MSTPEELENDFRDAMLDIYERARLECKYNATRFLQMVREYGGIETAKKLIHARNISDGFAELWACHRLDLTVEAVILKPEWDSLFSKEEKDIAKKRLKELGYKFD